MIAILFFIRQTVMQFWKPGQEERGEDGATERSGDRRGARDFAEESEGSDDGDLAGLDYESKGEGDRFIVAKSSHFQTVGLVVTFFVKANGYELKSTKMLDSADPSSTFTVFDVKNRVNFEVDVQEEYKRQGTEAIQKWTAIKLGLPKFKLTTMCALRKKNLHTRQSKALAGATEKLVRWGLENEKLTFEN